MAFKEATLLLKEHTSSTTTIILGRNERTEQMIIRLNEKYGLANKKCKLAKSTLHNAIAAGIVGKSQKREGLYQEI